MKKSFPLLIVFSLVFLNILHIASQAELIKSDWKLEEPEKPAVSALELETRTARIKALESKKKAEQEEIQKTKEEIQGKRKDFMKCLKEKGVILYSKENCPECKEQKAYFGDDFKDLEYIDCDKSRVTCPLNGINTYPTWYLGSRLGIKRKGVKDLPTLAKLTGCPW